MQNNEPELGAVKRKYEEALQDYLLFRALADLRRSWRIVLLRKVREIKRVTGINVPFPEDSQPPFPR